MSTVKYMGKRLIFAVDEHVVAFPTDLMDVLVVASKIDSMEVATLARLCLNKLDDTLPEEVVVSLVSYIVTGFAEAKEKADAKEHNVSTEST